MIARATHYEGFQSYGQKPITTLKPGQTSLERNYYSNVKTESQEGYLSTYNRWDSIYNKNLNTTVSPNDYKPKPRRILDEAGRSVIQYDKNILTSHWTTSYQNEFVEKDNSGKGKRPDWSYHQRPHQVRMPAEFYKSKYA